MHTGEAAEVVLRWLPLQHVLCCSFRSNWRLFGSGCCKPIERECVCCLACCPSTWWHMSSRKSKHGPVCSFSWKGLAQGLQYLMHSCDLPSHIPTERHGVECMELLACGLFHSPQAVSGHACSHACMCAYGIHVQLLPGCHFCAGVCIPGPSAWGGGIHCEGEGAQTAGGHEDHG